MRSEGASADARLLAPAPATPYLLRVAAGEATGLLADGIRAGLRALSWAYLGAAATSGLAHRIGLLRQERVPCPVIAIGNLTVGGTGKSTVTAEVARWLCNAGLRPAILSRGYGARSVSDVRIVSDGVQVRLGPEEGGDEPVMLGRHLSGVPVLVGRRRPITARTAFEQFGANVCLLDDGFQVWNLAKDLEIVLLDSARPFDNGFVLPRGLLREPVASLRRAHAVVLMEPERAHPEALAQLRRRIPELAPSAIVAEAHRVPDRLWRLSGEADPSMEHLQGTPVVALSAIGNPEGFEAILRGQGARVTPARLRDHHPYSRADLERVAYWARRIGAEAIVTTDKDAVKLAQHLNGARRSGSSALPLPVWVLSIRVRFTAGEDRLRERVLAVATRTADR